MIVAKTNTSRQQLPAVIVLLAALAVTAIAYAPGLGGSFHFDDPHSLSGLAQVADSGSAVRYIMEGDTGPLGRPLALASFLPQAYAWPSTPAVFLYVNVCIHLLNGVLVVWLLYLLGHAKGWPVRSAAWVAAMSAAIWLALPILASSSLLIVQRMTTLSATFVLLGLIAYLYSRKGLERRPTVALPAMALCVGLATCLAALAKESGLLLPLFVLAAEATILSAPTGTYARRLWQMWRILLLLPLLALAGYLTLQLQLGEEVVLRRGFSVVDRALTEMRILWQYLFNAFFPAASNLGPFHDDERIVNGWSDPSFIVAAFGWTVAIAGAFVWRHRAPLLAFAVSWYLLGHALESTTIPLELYFEHRNYLPLVGPVFALVGGVGTATWHQPLLRAALAAYAVLLAVVLFHTVSLWGNPPLAGEMWAKYSPTSSRATQYLAQQIQRTGDNSTVRRVLRGYLEENPGSIGVALQILALSCVLEPATSQDEQLRNIEAGLSEAKYEHGVFETLQGLYTMATEERCAAIAPETIYRLAATAASNPAYGTAPAALHNLQVLMAEHAFADRDLDRTMQHIEAALAARYTMTTLILGVGMLNSAGLFADAQDFVQAAYARAPRHPVRAAVWRRQLDELGRSISLASRE